MIFASGFSWFTLLEFLRDDHLLGFAGVTETSHLIATASFVSFGILLLAVLGRMGLERAKAKGGLEQFYADDRLTVRTFFEVFVTGAQGMAKDLLSREDVRFFLPFVGTLFLYIYFNNMIGILPGFLPITENINANVGMAISVFLVFMLVAFKRDAVGFLKHLWGPMFVTGFLIFPVELLGLFLRPVSLTLRLTGNMFGDHTAFNVVSGLAPLAPVGMLGLGLFVSFMRAFVFSLLTAVYISMSVPHHDHDDHAHDHH
jgi:F-type H+-transporting ATPase subunit a